MDPCYKEFIFTIEHCSGRDMTDTLSRITCDSVEITDTTHKTLYINKIQNNINNQLIKDLKQLSQYQREDDELSPIIHKLENTDDTIDTTNTKISTSENNTTNRK